MIIRPIFCNISMHRRSHRALEYPERIQEVCEGLSGGVNPGGFAGCIRARLNSAPAFTDFRSVVSAWLLKLSPQLTQ